MLAVIDASFFVARVMRDFPHEKLSLVDHAFDTCGDFPGSMHVPAHFVVEAANVFLMSYRRGKSNSQQFERSLEILKAFPCQIDHSLVIDRATALAAKHRLTFYDAAYLELTLRGRADCLFTFDNALMQAAEAEGIATRL